MRLAESAKEINRDTNGGTKKESPFRSCVRSRGISTLSAKHIGSSPTQHFVRYRTAMTFRQKKIKNNRKYYRNYFAGSVLR